MRVPPTRLQQAPRDQHERLAAALLDREGDLAEAIVREHIATALQVIKDKRR